MEINVLIEAANYSSTTQTYLWMSVTYIILGLVFAALAGWMIWIYFDNREVWNRERPDFDRKTTGSFRGYWERYRSFIVNFMAAVFILLAIAFVAMGALGIDVDSGYGPAMQYLLI